MIHNSRKRSIKFKKDDKISKNLKIKVCMITTSFPRFPDDSSSGVAIFEFARRLVEKGVNVTVIAPHAGGIKKVK